MNDAGSPEFERSQRNLAEQRAEALEREATALKARIADLEAIAKFAGRVLDDFAIQWGGEIDGLALQGWLEEAGLVDVYAPLTEADCERLAGEGYDMSEYDPGDTFYAYNGLAELARGLNPSPNGSNGK